MRIIDTNYFFSGDFQGQCALYNPKYGIVESGIKHHKPKPNLNGDWYFGITFSFQLILVVYIQGACAQQAENKLKFASCEKLISYMYMYAVLISWTLVAC